MKKTLLILFVAVISLTACKKDPEDKLKGRWDAVKLYSVVTSDGIKTNEYTNTIKIGSYYVVFNGNQYKIFDDGDLEDSGTFSATNDSITLTNTDGETETISLRWNSKSEIVFIIEDTESYGGKKYVDKSETTFKKN